jgi:hypothetical protein
MEDNAFDFGFSFEDDGLSVPQKVDPEFKNELLDKINSLENKLEDLTVGDTSSIIEQHKELVTAEIRGKLKEVEQLVLPLLYNLQKNPEKETIRWPNRKDIIQKQIDKILEVTRYYD